jgi:hypothetical protein
VKHTVLSSFMASSTIFFRSQYLRLNSEINTRFGLFLLSTLMELWQVIIEVIYKERIWIDISMLIKIPRVKVTGVMKSRSSEKSLSKNSSTSLTCSKCFWTYMRTQHRVQYSFMRRSLTVRAIRSTFNNSLKCCITLAIISCLLIADSVHLDTKGIVHA